MSITTISERETALANMLRKTGADWDAARAERDALKALVVKVHQARGRYHSQIAMAALYQACGLPNTKPISGEKS